MKTTNLTTRTEIADHLAGAFTGDALSRDEMVVAAAERGAPARVVMVLQRLPRGSYRDIRQLWPELPGLPIG